MSNRDACFVEPLAAALEIQEQITIAKTDKVAVIGDGKLGLLIAKSIALTGCTLTVFGRHQDKLDVLKDDALMTRIDLLDEDFGSFDIVVECTGNKKVFEQATRMLRPRGTLVMKSTHEGKTEFNTGKCCCGRTNVDWLSMRTLR